MSGVDVTAVARVLGIDSTFQDLGQSSIRNLPMRIAVCAQGNSDAVYSSEKWTALNAAAAGARYGYGSPIHRALLRLKPVNGDGFAGQVEILPLSDADGAVAAAGEIEVSGTQTETASYKVVIGGTKSRAFTIAKDATATAKYRAIMGAITAVLEMPATPTYSYGTVTAAPGGSNAGDGTCTALSAPGQPTPGDWTLELITEAVNGGVWSLTDPDGTVVADDITMTPGAGGATVITESGLQFTLTDGAADFEEGDTFTITVPVDHIALTAKWKGPSGNAVISVEDGDGGTTFALTQITGGTTNPTVDAALALIGNTWPTFILNGLNISDTTALDAYSEFGEGRRGVTVHKPLYVFTGNTEPDATTATVLTDARKTDRTNVQLVAPGSDDMPIDVAARQLARIAVVANNDPASDYGGRQATGLTPGTEAEQWDWPTRDYAVKRGSSTVELVDGVL